jgi:hypothetical protein
LPTEQRKAEIIYICIYIIKQVYIGHHVTSVTFSTGHIQLSLDKLNGWELSFFILNMEEKCSIVNKKLENHNILILNKSIFSTTICSKLYGSFYSTDEWYGTFIPFFKVKICYDFQAFCSQ